nr:uncharacterized protein LOC109155162 [Ipomoea batatas]
MKQITVDDDRESVELDHAPFWIQIHGIPIDFRSKFVLLAIGNFIRRGVKVDERNFDGSLQVFFCIYVWLRPCKPLKKGMKLKKDNGDGSELGFIMSNCRLFVLFVEFLAMATSSAPKWFRGGIHSRRSLMV